MMSRADSMLPEVLVMGRALVDFYPERDGPLADVREYRSAVGGSPANVSIAAATLGARAALISCVGDDPLGRFVVAELKRRGVDVSEVRTQSGITTPIAVCQIDPPDDSTLTFYRPEPAADVQLSWDALDRSRITGASIVWASLSGLSGSPAREAVVNAFASRPRTSHTVLDLDYRPSFWASRQHATDTAHDALELASIAIGNMEECRIALDLDDHATPDHAADALLERGAVLAVIKQGGDGVLGATADSRIAVAPQHVSVVNGLGAGDAFGGALCFGLLQGMSLEELLSFANAAGALVAARRGASEAMPTRADVVSLLASGSPLS